MSTQAHPSAVSVVVPCRDGAAYLAEALDSVLSQEPAPVEVVVVDDGSTDDSVAIASSFGPRVRCVRQDSAGAACARNRGVAETSGALLGFLDADDLWMPGRIARQTAALAAHPEASWVLGATEQFVSPELDPARFRFDPGPFVARLSGAFLMRRAAFERVGPFSTSLVTADFVDWFLRAEDLGLRPIELPDVVLRRRLHRTNHGVVRAEARIDYVRVIKAALDRRRSRPAPGTV